MKSIFFIIITCLVFVSSYAQNNKDLVGKWEYKTFEGSEEMDSLGKAFMDEMLGSTSYYIQADGKYRVKSSIKSYEGIWTYDEDKKEFNGETYAGSGENIKMELVNANEILLSLSRFKVFFTKVNSDKEKEIKDFIINDKLVSVNVNKLSKKWFKTHSYNPNDSELLNEMSNKTLKNNYYHFNKSGSGKYEVYDMVDDFDWKLNNDGTKLYIQFEKKLLIWHIIKCTKKELVLLKGNTEEKWFFSSSEPKLEEK